MLSHKRQKEAHKWARQEQKRKEREARTEVRHEAQRAHLAVVGTKPADTTMTRVVVIPSAQFPSSHDGGDGRQAAGKQDSIPVRVETLRGLLIIASTPDPLAGPWWEQVAVISPQEARHMVVGSRVYLDPKRVDPDPNQPRKNFKADDLADLAESIKEEGQKNPGKVYRKYGDPDHDWVVLDSERRWRACTMKGVPFWADIVPPPANRINKLADQITLNMGNVGHDHMEIILAIQEFIQAGKSISWIARKFVKSQAWVSNYVRAAALPGLVIEMLSSALPDNERLRFPVALLLLKFPAQYQLGIAQQVRGKAMSEASRIINRELGEAEPESGVRKRQPKDDRGLVETALDSTIRSLRGLEDMSDEQLDRMFAHVPSDTVKAVLASMKRATELTAAVQGRILACLPNATKAEPARHPVSVPAGPALPMKRPGRPAPAVAPPPVHRLEVTGAVGSDTAPPSAPTPPLAASVELQVHDLILAVDSDLEAMLAAMEALAKAIKSQEEKLRTLLAGLPDEKRRSVYNRAEAVAKALAWFRFIANPDPPK